MKTTTFLLSLVFGATCIADDLQLPKQAIVRIGASDDVMRGVYVVAFSPVGKLIATRGRDQVIRLWDTKTGKERHSLAGHQDRVTSLAFSIDGKTLISASDGIGEVVRVWNTSTGKSVAELSHGGLIVQPSVTSEQLAVVERNRVSYYQPGADTPHHSAALKLSSSTIPLCLSPDEQSLVCVKSQGGIDTSYELSDYEIGTGNQKLLAKLGNRPTAARYSPDGRQLVVACRRETSLHVFQLGDSVKHEREYGHDGPIQSVAYSPDGRFLATASWDKTVRVWELLTGGIIGTLAGHTEHVCAVSFSNDGQLLASGASGPTDNSTLLWNVRRVVLGQHEPQESLNEDDAAKLWDQLAGEPKDAFQAIDVFRELPGESVPFIKTKIAELVPTTNADEIKQLIVKLDDDKFQVREAAQLRLMELRVIADEVLRSEFETTSSFEVKTRLKQILETPKREKPLPESERRRVHRLIYALELIGTTDAREQLSRLAAGFPNTEIIRDAKASIQRVDDRNDK